MKKNHTSVTKMDCNRSKGFQYTNKRIEILDVAEFQYRKVARIEATKTRNKKQQLGFNICECGTICER